MVFKRFSAIVVAMCCAAAPMAHASPIDTERAVTVRLDDVDANSKAGARLLLRRIERAASFVCGESLARRYVSLQRDFRRCRAMTIVSTIDRIGTERLHSEYVTRYGHS